MTENQFTINLTGVFLAAAIVSFAEYSEFPELDDRLVAAIGGGLGVLFGTLIIGLVLYGAMRLFDKSKTVPDLKQLLSKCSVVFCTLYVLVRVLKLFVK